jgi:error-prone DNA polymerase
MRPVFLEQHSVYSLCEGVPFISELVSRAVQTGEKYMALCDTNGFYGVVNFVARCREEGLVPLIGARLKHPSFEGLLIARNMKGYAQISSLISGIHLNRDSHPGFNLKETILNRSRRHYVVITRDREVLAAASGTGTGGSATGRSAAGRAGSGRADAAGRSGSGAKNSTGGGRCSGSGAKNSSGVYAEINVLRKDYTRDYAAARKRGIPPVFISPVYFLKPEDHRLHLLLRAIQHNKKLDALTPKETQSRYACWRDPEELAREYSFMPDALENTQVIARACTFDFAMGNVIAPGFCRDSFQLLEELCRRNLPRRYPHPDARVHERLQKELALIKKKGFADYFLIVHDLVKRSPYTCGRGSAAASLVSYLLFITHVDPIAHNLFFERFLNEERPDPPDIDIDFPWDTRDDILGYLFEKYTTRRSAMVSNHVTFSARSSVREVAKVYGIPGSEIGRVTGNIGFYYNREFDEFERYSKTRDSDFVRAPAFRDVFRDAVEMHGRPRYLSVHCGGVVVTPKPIYYYIPVEPAPKGVNVIQLEKDQAEDFGFVKIDVLGNRSLAVVRDVLEQARRHYGHTIEYEGLNPLDDRRTIDTLARGETMGVFYTESPAMRQLQRKTGRGDYEHLVIHSSIIRPAANAYIREYVERLHGKPYTPLLPEMGDILNETYGIMCYQEDITRIALKIAGFPMGEADEIRKVILKKNKIRRKLELKDKFFRSLLERGVSLEVTEKIWTMIESFSGYSFCKPHSASFALLSFKACYLKTRYPAEFLGAVLRHGGGYYSPLAYLSEARRLGLRVERPDINLSREEYYGQGGTVHMGLKQIKGISSRAVKAVLRERERRGHFAGLYDFMERTGAGARGESDTAVTKGAENAPGSVGQSDLVLLIKAGAFRNVESYNQPQLLYMAKSLAAAGGRVLGREMRAGLRPTPPPMRDITADQKLLTEQELFGFIASIHPMEYYRKKLQRRPGAGGPGQAAGADDLRQAAGAEIIQARDLGRFPGREVRVAGIMITAKTVMTRNSELMQFISFEDETDIFETVFFPGTYRKFALSLSLHRPSILHGRVEEEFGVASLTVHDVTPVGNLRETGPFETGPQESCPGALPGKHRPRKRNIS